MPESADKLGGVPYRSFGNNVSADTLTTQGFGYAELTAATSPTGAYRGWYLLVIGDPSNARDTWQFVSEDSASLFNLYTRKRHDNNWTPWKQINLTTV